MDCTLLDSQKTPVTAHIANTGSLKEVFTQKEACPQKALLSYSKDPKRKLKYSLQMIKAKATWVGVNTHLANSLLWEQWENYQKQKPIKMDFFYPYQWGQREVKVSEGTRIDFVFHKNKERLLKLTKNLSKKILLEKIPWQQQWLHEEKFHFIEVKNVSMAKNSIASFPDAKTTRGLKHIKELLELQKQGHTVEMVFVVQRSDCHSFQPAKDIDPQYSQALKAAYDQCLKVSAFPCLLNPNEICLNTTKPLKIIW